LVPDRPRRIPAGWPHGQSLASGGSCRYRRAENRTSSCWAMSHVSEGQEIRSSFPRSRRRAPQLQVPLVASPRNQILRLADVPCDKYGTNAQSQVVGRPNVLVAGALLSTCSESKRSTFVVPAHLQSFPHSLVGNVQVARRRARVFVAAHRTRQGSISPSSRIRPSRRRTAARKSGGHSTLPTQGLPCTRSRLPGVGGFGSSMYC
jgi:hypothetical protein